MKTTTLVLSAIFSFGIHTTAIAQTCHIQCTTAQGKNVGAKFVANSAHGGECKSRGIRAVKSKCDGNGTIKYGACFGNIINNKIMKSKMTSC